MSLDELFQHHYISQECTYSHLDQAAAKVQPQPAAPVLCRQTELSRLAALF